MSLRDLRDSVYGEAARSTGRKVCRRWRTDPQNAYAHGFSPSGISEDQSRAFLGAKNIGATWDACEAAYAEAIGRPRPGDRSLHLANDAASVAAL